MKKCAILLILISLWFPLNLIAADTLSFDIDGVYYEDENRIFDIDFSTGTEEDYGDLNLNGTWSTKSGGHDPGMYFHPSDGDDVFFTIDAANGLYKVSIPKPLNDTPTINSANNIVWDNESYYINEGSEIDFRGDSLSANVEYIKLAFDAAKENLRIFLKVSDDTDLGDIGFRFVFMPEYMRGNYNGIAYLSGYYPASGIVVDAKDITVNSGNVKMYKVVGGNAVLLNDQSPTMTRSGDTLEITIGVISDDSGVINLAVADFVMEGLSYNNLNDPPQRADFFSPNHLFSNAIGEFTAVSGDLDGQPVSTNWFYSVRLKNLQEFSYDTLNEFTIGFTGNNVAGYETAPGATIIGKWVKGFYRGKKYKKSMLFKSDISNSGSVEGEWQTEDPVEVANVSPEDAIIDLAMKTEENGTKINFYYRIYSNSDNLPSIATYNDSWVLFNSFSITAGDPVYGYQVNKGIISIKSDILEFPVGVPKWGMNRNNNVKVDATEIISKSTTELATSHNLTDFDPMSPTEKVEMTVDPGEKVVLRYLFHGCGKKAGKLALYKLKNLDSLEFGNYVSNPDPNVLNSGDWWITEYGVDPDDALVSSDWINKGAKYVIYFVVRDNDGVYDLDDTEGRILDPTVIGEYSGTSSTNSGGGGDGCFIATAAYGSLMEPHVKILRDFRDRFLIGNTVGKNFVSLYYSYSPPIADFIAEHDSLKIIVRIGLLPVVGVSWIVLKFGPISTVALMLIFISCFVGLVCFSRRYKE
jgi:hypothetical protein